MRKRQVRVNNFHNYQTLYELITKHKQNEKEVLYIPTRSMQLSAMCHDGAALAVECNIKVFIYIYVYMKI